MIFKSKKDKMQKSVQNLIPVKAIKNGRIFTDDNRIIQILKASAINLELMSEYELHNTFEKYQMLLREIDFNFQVEIVSQPVNLESTVKKLKAAIEKEQNPYRKMLQKDHLEYIQGIETSQGVMQRQRYIVMDVQLKDGSEAEYQRMIEILDEREKMIRSALKTLEIAASRATEKEISQLFQVLFDYEASLKKPIQAEKLTNIVTGGNKSCKSQKNTLKTNSSISSQEKQQKAASSI